MMIGIVGEYVAAGAERPPTNTRFIKFINDRRRFLFSIRCDDPIDRTPHAQAC